VPRSHSPQARCNAVLPQNSPRPEGLGLKSPQTALQVLVVASHDWRLAPCLRRFEDANAALERNGNRP